MWRLRDAIPSTYREPIKKKGPDNWRLSPNRILAKPEQYKVGRSRSMYLFRRACNKMVLHAEGKEGRQ